MLREKEMTKMRYFPYCECDTLWEEKDSVMTNLPRIPFIHANSRRGFLPGIDIIEDSKGIRFDIEIPGVPKEDVSVTINKGNILTIRGEKKLQAGMDINLRCRNERYFGAFSRSFQLPQDIDSDKIEAEYKNGLLRLFVPKMEFVKPGELDIAIN